MKKVAGAYQPRGKGVSPYMRKLWLLSPPKLKPVPRGVLYPVLKIRRMPGTKLWVLAPVPHSTYRPIDCAQLDLEDYLRGMRLGKKTKRHCRHPACCA